MKKIRSVIEKETTPSCFFRSAVESPYRKALIRITDACNAHCVHCFISANNRGQSMTLNDFRRFVLPRLQEIRVSRVTLTGGEPFIHPNLIEMVQLLADANISTGICTNATLITDEQINALADINNVHINVSLHGFTSKSHDRFMGEKGAFEKCKIAIKLLSDYGLLQGLLVTPNCLTELDEYAKLCEFAIRNKAKYVLMNPLSPMGRGFVNVTKYAASESMLRSIKEITHKYVNKIQIVYIRFPNDNLPLGSCEAGNILYVFVNGNVSVCAYLDFAANTPISLYDPEDFIIGNLFTDTDFVKKMDSYSFHKKYQVGNNDQCKQCDQNKICGKGCPSAIICKGKKIGDVDSEICPNVRKMR